MQGFRDCWKNSAGKGWLTRLFTCIPVGLDSFWRWRDFRFNRSYGGWMKRWGLDDHCPLAFLMPAALLFFLVAGPTSSWSGGWALLGLFGGWILLFGAAKLFPARWLFPVELGVLALWAFLLWWLVPADALEAENTLYLHFLIPLYLFMIVPPLLILWLVAKATLSRVRSDPSLGVFLPHVNLFAPPPEVPNLDGFSVFRAFVYVPMRYPLHLLFVPALLTLLLPYNVKVGWWAAVILVLWWIMLAAIADHRLSGSLQLMRRAFFIGGQLVVSLVVIVLAIGRVAGISYVQTVVESTNLRILISYIASAYVVFWFYEYWLNRILLERLLGFLQTDSPKDETPGKVEYTLDSGETGLAASAVKADRRRLQIHGGGRFMSIGCLKPDPDQPNRPEEAFEPYEKKDLFEALVRKASWSEDPEVRKAARSHASLEKVDQIQRGVRFYFSFANLLLIVIAVGAVLWLTSIPQTAAVEVQSSSQGEPRIRLAETIWQSEPSDEPAGDEEQDKGPDKALFLAASGGGTRAALYTESVLRGFAHHGVLDDLVLASGVSGGGAALAYLAAYRDALLSQPPPSEAWDRFACDLSRPFIWDVLEGSAEWRIVTGTRSGKLLQESFERGFGFPQDRSADTENPPPVPTLGDAGNAGLGLIFNTSLAGHLEVTKGRRPNVRFDEAAAGQRKSTDGSVAGGRLIFTNLDLGDDFPTAHPSTDAEADLHLHYVVIDDLGVPVTTAAALNANFPPVFSNAPVDELVIGPDSKDEEPKRPDPKGGDPKDKGPKLGDRYWVTDGGAVENRGILSLLLALRSAVRELDPDNPPPHLPELHIVMAEASAGSRGYQQDRGVGTSFGAAGKVANQAIGELLEDIRTSYDAVCSKSGRRCEVVYHDLSMPEILRIDSGLGTHWMLPRTVEVNHSEGSVVLGSDAVRHAIHRLHQPDLPAEPAQCDGEGIGLWGRASNALWETLGWMESRESRLKKLDKWLKKSEHQKAWKLFLCQYAEEGVDGCPAEQRKTVDLGESGSADVSSGP